MSLALFVSLWTLQPGTTSILVLLPVLVLVTWWSPRPDDLALEDRFGLPFWQRFTATSRAETDAAGSPRQAVP